LAVGGAEEAAAGHMLGLDRGADDGQLKYGLPFPWFASPSVDDEAWTATTFTENHDGLLEGDMAAAFLQCILAQARGAHLPSDEPITVDGALVVAWANRKSVRQKGDRLSLPDGRWNPTVDLHGERRSQATPVSKASPKVGWRRRPPAKRRSSAPSGRL
jgi:hypothetical protein